MVAYLTLLAFDPVVALGGWRALVAVAGAVAAAGLVLLARHIVGERLIVQSVIDLAYFDTRSGERMERPWGAMLISFGKELGYPSLEDEPQADYARRVFGIDNIEPGGPT